MKTKYSASLIRFALPCLAMAGLLALTSSRAHAQDQNVSGNLTVNGTTTLYDTLGVDANVGIGSSSPGRALVVSINGGCETVTGLPDYGSPETVVTNGGGLAGLRILGTYQSFLQLYSSNSSYGGYLRLDDNGMSGADFQLGFDHTGVIAMTVLDSGNVGIGTTTPAAALDVDGEANISGDASISGNTNMGYANVSDDATINGNVLVGTNLGIGTASPGHPFVLSEDGGNEDNDMGNLGGPLGVITTGDAWGGLRIMGASQGFLQLYTATDSLGGYVRVGDQGGSPATAIMQFGFDHDSVIAMNILDNGNVGIGTTTPAAALDVSGEGNISGNLSVGGTVNGEKIVVTSTIDATVSGNTTIYTPASGKSFSVTAISVENVDVTSLTSPGSLTFSAGGTTNNVTNSLTMSSASTGKEFKPAFTSQPFICTDSTPLTLRITTGSSALAHDIKIVVTGVEY